MTPEVFKRLIGHVKANEGGYDAVNRNTDGAGVSVGIFQWSQRSGQLGVLLRAYHRANPKLFVGIFGPAWKELLDKASQLSMDPIEGSMLWKEPWVSRFKSAGREPVFRDVQDYLAMNSDYVRAAVRGADELGFITERSLAVILDAAVTQGPEFAVRTAREVARRLVGKVLPMDYILSEYLGSSIAHFRSKTQPPKPSKAHMSWQKVGAEWHKHAGQVDLYASMLRRRKALLATERLADAVLTPATQAIV